MRSLVELSETMLRRGIYIVCAVDGRDERSWLKGGSPMSKSESANKVYNIIAVVFAGEKRAQEVAAEMKWHAESAADEQGMKIISRAVVAVDASGKTHVHETGHRAKGATIGAVAGGL